MIKLSKNGLKFLKALHLLIIAGWFGGGIAMNLLVYQIAFLDQPSALLTAFRLIDIIDIQLVATCAMLTLLIGLIYGIFTNWGFFKQTWITIKWIITVLVIYSGAVYSSSNLENMEAMVEQIGIAALQHPEYLSIAQYNQWLGIVQLVLLASAVVLSIWKPKRKGKAADA